MKKVFLFSMIIAVGFIFSGCGKKDANKAQNNGDQSSIDSLVKENSSIFSWMKKGGEVKCSLNMTVGNILMMTKNNNVRIEGIPFLSSSSMGEAPQADNGVSLTLGEWVYMWDKKTKKGTKMNNKEMLEFSGDSGDIEESELDSQGSWEDMVNGWDEMNTEYSCKEENLDDNLFEVPEDVEFQNLTEMMNSLNEAGKKIENQMNEDGSFDMDALNDMTEEMKNLGL